MSHMTVNGRFAPVFVRLNTPTARVVYGRWNAHLGHRRYGNRTRTTRTVHPVYTVQFAALVVSMDTSISLLPSPCLFPMMIDNDNKTFYLSPLHMATPLPCCTIPPICGNCLGYVPIPIPSCTPTPQLAIRSTPFSDHEACDWKKAATNLASMIGATMVECKLPMKQAASRVLHYVYLTLISENSQKSEEDDESTLISTSSSTSSS